MSKTLTIPEIMERYPADWGALSRQQKVFVEACIAGGISENKRAAVAACKLAYPKFMLNSDPKARLTRTQGWTSRLMNNPRVKRVLNRHRGLNDLESLCDDIGALVKRSGRKGGTPHDVLIAPWLRVAAALEALAGKES